MKTTTNKKVCKKFIKELTKKIKIYIIKKKQWEKKQMKNPESLEAVYIYIYIVKFNKINIYKHRETMLFRRI